MKKPDFCNNECAGADYTCCYLTEDFGCLLEQEREADSAAREEKLMAAMGGHMPGGLLVYLRESGFFEAPASIKYHGAHDGGLFEHSYAVMTVLVDLTRRLDLKWERERSPYIVGMFHDICKADDYRRGVGGKWEYNKAPLMPGHGDKSAIMLSQFITLTEEEMLCIRWHMGAFDEKELWNHYGRACEKYPNVLYTHTADMIASRIMGV